MTKVSVEKIAMERYEVEFPLDDIREMLRFEHNGTKMRLPYNAVLSYVGASPDSGPAKLVATFELDVTPPTNGDMSQREVDVWGLIRLAGTGGTSYQGIQASSGALTDSQVKRAVASLVQRGLVWECETREPSTSGGAPRKLWRSVE